MFRNLLRLGTADRRGLAATSRVLSGAIAAAVIVALASGAHADDEGKFPVAWIKFKTNATDGDVGVQAYIDADGLEKVRIKNPDGDTIFEAAVDGGLGEDGVSELFFQGSEPLVKELVPEDSSDEAEYSIDEIFELFPPGEYEFEGRTADGATLESTFMLNTVLPAGPHIVAPEEDAEAAAGAPLAVRWQPVTKTILPDLGDLVVAGYHVVVINEEQGGKFEIDLPADATTVTVPAAFMRRGAAYSIEVRVIEQGGNQTLSESVFRTSN